MAPKIKLLANADKTGNPKGPTNRRFPTRIFTLSHTIKIGVIDDDDLVRGAIDSLIQSLGYEVDTFTSAADYLSSNRLHDHSCIIADLQMTGITGTDFQKQLMSKGLSTPIIFIGAYCTQALVRRVTEAGAIGFLLKPFKVEPLLEYLAKALKTESAGG